MRSRIYWLLVSFLITLLVGYGEYLGVKAYFFYRFWWYDIPMHILAGAAVGTFFVGFVPRRMRIGFLLFVAAIAIGWEVFEYFSGISYPEPNYILDTSHDLLDDAVGATVAYITARLSIWRSK